MLKSLETDNDEDEHLPVKPNYDTPQNYNRLRAIKQTFIKKML